MIGRKINMTNKASHRKQSKEPVKHDEAMEKRMKLKSSKLKKQSKDNSLYLLTCTTVFSGVLTAIVYYNYWHIIYAVLTNKSSITFASQDEIVNRRSQIVECSEGYKKEVEQFEGCQPKNCGRHISDFVVTEEEVDQLLLLAGKGFAYGGSLGGASILDLHSGALSKGKEFINVYKTDAVKEFHDSEFEIYKQVKNKIQYAVAINFGVDVDKIFLTHPTFFSKINDKEAVTEHDIYWNSHIDKETYPSFHYTSLLYLNDFNKDFLGGRFVFVDPAFNSTIEPRKGRVSMFTSGWENVHHIEKVIKGTRYAITVSFTCDKEYAIDEPTLQKEIIED